MIKNNCKLYNLIAMKKIRFFIIVFSALFFLRLGAQAPDRFQYQAVARNAQGQVLNNQIINVRFNIRQGGATGFPVYEEQHVALTNTLGLFTLQIGGGAPTTGNSFSNINWASGNYWLEVQIQTTTMNQFLSMGSSQFLSVPYSKYAADGPDADPTNELQTLSKSGNIITLSNGGGSVDVNDADANPTNEIQQLSISGNTLSISGSGGNSISLPVTNRVAYLKDVKFNDTPGGDVTGEVWHTRVLNTLSGDAGFVQLTGGSIGTGGTANQFILQPGTYQVEAFCPAQQINVHLAKLVNVTDGQDILIGSAGYSPVNVHAVSPSIIMGEFTINSPKTFAILHRGASSRPHGFGVSHWWGDNVFSQVKIVKVN